jgi:retron-type reverse transcriptase
VGPYEPKAVKRMESPSRTAGAKLDIPTVLDLDVEKFFDRDKRPCGYLAVNAY